MNVILKDRAKTRVLIAKTGKSLRTFSKDIGVSQGYLSQILGKKKNPSVEVAYKIAQGIGTDLDNIFLIEVNDISVKEAT